MEGYLMYKLVLLIFLVTKSFSYTGIIHNMEAYFQDNTYGIEVYGDFEKESQIFEIYLDTDNNILTGYGDIGADYFIDYVGEVYNYIGENGSQDAYWENDKNWYNYWEWKSTVDVVDIKSNSITIQGYDNILTNGSKIYLETYSHDWDYQDHSMIQLDNMQDDEKEKQTFFSKHILDASLQIQYPEGKPFFIDKDESQNYYYKKGNMVFDIQHSQLKRVELRDTHEWGLNDIDSIKMEGNIKLNIFDNTSEITWMQLHHKSQGAKPFVRLVWKEEKDNRHNGLWAVIRKNEDNNGDVASWHYLGSLSVDHFFTSKISISHGNTLYIAVNNNELTLEVPEYWKNLMYDNQRFYFKAGLYFSGKNVDKKAIVEYKSLFVKEN